MVLSLEQLWPIFTLIIGLGIYHFFKSSIVEKNNKKIKIKKCDFWKLDLQKLTFGICGNLFQLWVKYVINVRI